MRAAYQSRGLGIAPLIIAGAGAAGGAVLYGGGQWLWDKARNTWTLLTSTVPSPVPPPVPSAPQTRNQMTVPGAWTPDELSAYDRQTWSNWSGRTPRATDVGESPDPDETSSGFPWLIAAGAVLLLFSLRR